METSYQTPIEQTSIKINAIPSVLPIFALSQEERTKVVELGLSLYNQGIQKLQTMSNNELDKRINEVQASYQMTINELENANNALKKQINDITSNFRKEKTELSIQISEDANLRFKNQIDALQAQNHKLQERINDHHIVLNEENAKQQEKHESKINELRELYEKKIELLREQQDQMRIDYEQRVNAITVRSQNSSMKGQDGEEELYYNLNRLFPTAHIEDTHATPGKCDFIVRMEQLNMMVENKNYTRNVQKQEIDKFYRDIDDPANSDINCGMFVSMKSGICSRQDFQIEVRNGKPIIFLHKISENMNHLRIAASFFTMLLSQKNIDFSSSQLMASLNDITKAIKTSYKKQKSRLDKYYQDQTKANDDQEAQIAQLFMLLKTKY